MRRVASLRVECVEKLFEIRGGDFVFLNNELCIGRACLALGRKGRNGGQETHRCRWRRHWGN